MRALIIDDSLLLRKMVQKAVNSAIPAINQFEYAGDDIEAVQVLRSALRSKQKYALIVTDMNMPKMSGLEVMEQIQKEELCPTTHIIMITTENNAGMWRERRRRDRRGASRSRLRRSR